MSPSGWTHYLAFYPRVAFGGDVVWNNAAPLRFHAEVSADAPAGFEVRFSVGDLQTAEAVEVSPGVFEATMGQAGRLSPNVVTPILIEISSDGPVAEIAIGTKGDSWVDVPSATSIRSVPEMIAADTYGPDPREIVTAERTIHLNDADFTYAQFNGTLVPNFTRTVNVPRPARAVFAWLEGLSDPIVKRVIEGRQPDARQLFQFGEVRARRGVTTLAAAERTLGLMDQPAGPIDLDVYADSLHSSLRNAVEGLPVTLHVLQIHGERTLRDMEWAVPSARWSTFNTPVTASCPYGVEPIPQWSNSPTFRVDLRAFAAVSGQRWTLNFELPGLGLVPCGEMQTGESIRMTLGGSRMWYMGPTPHRYTNFVSVEDVSFRMKVTYTYDP